MFPFFEGSFRNHCMRIFLYMHRYMYAFSISNQLLNQIVYLFACSTTSETLQRLFWCFPGGRIRTKKIHTCHSPQVSCFGLFLPFCVSLPVSVLLLFEKGSVFQYQILCSCSYYTLMVIRPKEFIGCFYLVVFGGPFWVFFMRNVQYIFLAFCTGTFLLLCQPKKEKRMQCIVFSFGSFLGIFVSISVVSPCHEQLKNSS